MNLPSASSASSGFSPSAASSGSPRSRSGVVVPVCDPDRKSEIILGSMPISVKNKMKNCSFDSMLKAHLHLEQFELLLQRCQRELRFLHTQRL